VFALASSARFGFVGRLFQGLEEIRIIGFLQLLRQLMLGSEAGHKGLGLFEGGLDAQPAHEFSIGETFEIHVVLSLVMRWGNPAAVTIVV
jgi:hypothetical protein